MLLCYRRGIGDGAFEQAAMLLIASAFLVMVPAVMVQRYRELRSVGMRLMPLDRLLGFLLGFFWLIVLMMTIYMLTEKRVVGRVGPLSDPNVKAMLAPVTLTVICLVGIVLLFRPWRWLSYEWGRVTGPSFRDVAEQLGLAYVRRTWHPLYIDRSRRMIRWDHPQPASPVGTARPKVLNLLHGRRGEYDVYIYDDWHRSHACTSASRGTQTVMLVEFEHWRLPVFELRPQGVFDFIGARAGLEDIDFEDSPDFSDQYLLRGADEAAIRTLFALKIRSYLADRPGLCIEGGGRRVAMCRAGKRLTPREVPAFMDECLELCGLIRHHAEWRAG